jgi:hypothetical protein
VGPGRPTGTLDRNVFGGFVEHLGRCINGGIFDEGSSLSDNKGFRRDVLVLLKPLRLSYCVGRVRISRPTTTGPMGSGRGHRDQPARNWLGAESNQTTSVPTSSSPIARISAPPLTSA